MIGRTLTLFRSDNMGDVIVSLWSAAWIKRCYPELKLFLVTRRDWEPIIRRCDFLEDWCALEDFMAGKLSWSFADREHIVFFYSRPEEALQARRLGFKKRTGTGHRWWHWLYSNERIFFSRKRSSWHEAQLNLLLLRKDFPKVWPCSLEDLRRKDLFTVKAPPECLPRRIVLHPFSNLSAPLWPGEHWTELIRILKEYNDTEIFITGLASDLAEAQHMVKEAGVFGVRNLCGQFSLSEFIKFLETTDALVAPSTGPLHLAAALGLRTVGLYVPRKPMHPGRWAPLGRDVRVLTGADDCRQSCVPGSCRCMTALLPAKVLTALGFS